MRHGIGIITTGARTIKDSYFNTIDRPTSYYVHLDKERNGPGYGRNQCIHFLYEAGCDFITIFDDDTWPVLKGWQTYLIDNMLSAGLHGLTLDHHLQPSVRAQFGEVIVSKANIGAFLTITRKAVEEVGYFNPAYKGYGWEDVAYRDRIRRSNINGYNAGDVSLVRLHEYIFSEDVMKPADHTEYANMTRQEKDADIARNRAVFSQEIRSKQIYFPFSG